MPAHNFLSPGVTTDFPDVSGFDLVVPMGAPWASYDETIGTWVSPSWSCCARPTATGIPVLGICFGGQLLALAHGGTVAKARQAEFGWVSIESDDEALVPTGPWFQWHHDGWTVPPGAREIARNAAASQAFVAATQPRGAVPPGAHRRDAARLVRQRRRRRAAE